ncbi:MAG TPA: gamma-glutamylcyclotransferase family protein [Sphingobium sp.]
MFVSPTLLFVYGTLRKGGGAPLAARLEREARWIGRAEARGFLYSIGGYPGFVSDAAGGRVMGDLFDIGQNVPLLAVLDAYEQCGGAWPEPQEYRREIIPVLGERGAAQAWTYVYAWPVDQTSLIASGDFLA